MTQQFFRAMFAWNSVAPYQCMLTPVRGQNAPVIYHQGKLHLVIPNSEFEPFITGHHQGLIINALIEGIRWNSIECSMTTTTGYDDQKIWSCTLSKDGELATSTSKNLYIAMINSYVQIFRACHLEPSETDPVVKADFSIPSD